MTFFTSIAFITLALCLTIKANPIIQEQEWDLYKTEFRKAYANSIEDKFRKNIFLKQLQLVQTSNEKYSKGEITFEMEINAFSDHTKSELQALKGLKRTSTSLSSAIIWTPESNITVPSSVDCRKLGLVTEVKDQGKCGSCFIFSAIGALEGQHKKSTGKLVSLSEQNVLDCKGADQCEGGWPSDVYQFINTEKGVDTEVSYPYKASESQCRFKNAKVGATCKYDFFQIKVGDEIALKAAIFSAGPISIGIDANHASFFGYKSGIWSEPDCSSTQLDHAVLAVGYGTCQKTGKDYYIVKNSWNKSWGLKGYFLLERNAGNKCGVATLATFPKV
uniref:Pept_C1 domain-containing protein n=1 Tax=Rhabditophanes sp. KR3021 TaxID=114890 RepID=A0AC35UB01_9BILA